ncbi:flagellar biosynthesis protein FlhA [Parvularcula bermudensis HTCC2503]|uniref:Flagellar biosynthesis protein FlhA n=1 Tax=Parvularcula bermudensis (strain ATCC BAA-594 / HTCC2503 / KCTC 12087) TaxID=314260 RepID=E0TH65_PARBH|nr:flagellar biosynthesis protein FlhA [Parvularcula bermudensis]ADM09649.1 flagellar biosynthesis protein FlhA [Parvularcula bermudensis HTCC2503]
MSEAVATPTRIDAMSILREPAVLLAMGLMVIIVMMILPVPPIVLDIGLTASFAFAILIFTITLFIEKPLDFSAFPSVLLMSLLLRLSLNISSTKLIIGEGHTGTGAAGNVIEGFAMFIMNGNLIMGLIIFTVLIIVNFLVITKGAGRMAEVGARFALDAMPGRQLAIDADVAAGAITHEEARRLRELQQEETAFLGSLDGVSKFVKGDAVAGLLITLLNLVAGIAIGMGVHDVSLGEAVQNYSVLTVGDGLVSQIPAVIISVAAALLLSKGQGKGSVDVALFGQMTGSPYALLTVAMLLTVFALLPGLPFLPFMLGAGAFGYLGWRGLQATARRDALALEEEKATDLDALPAPATLGDSLDLDEIHVELDRGLSSILSGSQESFDKRIEKLRTFIVSRYGFVMPPVRVTDAALGSGAYRISLQGTKVGEATLMIDHSLALVKHADYRDIPGVDATEPVYKAEARWVTPHWAQEMADRGITVIEPVEILATHLLESVQNNFERLMSRRALREALDALTNLSDPVRAESNKKLLDEFLPEKVTYDTLQWVMRGLLAEKISVRNVPLLLEAIVEHQPRCPNIDDLIEAVRRQLAFQFIEEYKSPDGTLPVVQLGQTWDKLLADRLRPDPDNGGTGALSADEYKRLGDDVQEALNKAAMAGAYAAIAVTGRRRRFVRDVVSARAIKNPVIAFEEIGSGARPAILAVI